MNRLKQAWFMFYQSFAYRILIGSYLIALVGGLGISWWELAQAKQGLVAEVGTQEQRIQTLDTELTETLNVLSTLQSEDQVVKNASLAAEIMNIKKSFAGGQRLFEVRSDLAITGSKTKAIDLELAKFLGLLSEQKWREAEQQSIKVQAEIERIVTLTAPKVSEPSVVSSNTTPNSGYSRQSVSTPRGNFVVSLIAAPGARAVVETAAESDCSDNCPTRTLAEHVAAAGGFAGINGAYFCPPDYPRCQGKVNSFDTLAVNGRTKAVLNRANNVYSSVPLVAMYGTTLSFYDQTVHWGVDTSSGGAIANYPRLLRDGNVATGDEGSRGTRGFIGTKDGTIVIGHVFAANLADTAEVLKTIGLQNALTLDGGGSAALWIDGGYKVGPGRTLPTAIVLVR